LAIPLSVFTEHGATNIPVVTNEPDDTAAPMSRGCWYFIGQPYRAVCGAFSNLRHQLGRCDDEPWYRYTFSDTDFAVNVEASSSSNFDPRHRQD
jgi:hypothetical protein